MLSTAAALLSLAVVAATGSPPASAASRRSGPQPALFNPHAGQMTAPAAVPARPSAGAAPIIGTTFPGFADPQYTPPDANGAVGPNNFIEVVNSDIAIYNRLGVLLATTDFNTLTGDGTHPLSDPMILWDPDTQRFYYNVWDIDTQTMDWGFSKSSSVSGTGDFCNYISSFGYAPTEFPDYPKLGQTKGFLLIGVNHYPSLTAAHADRSDVLWIQKPQGSGPITTCPTNAFGTGKFVNIRNQGGSQAWTPVPAIQTDPSGFGFVVASSDIECPDICGTGTLLTVYGVRPKPGNPNVPQLSKPHSITVAGFQPPDDAPQPNPQFNIDTLDGRLTHAVSGVDPSVGKVTIWTAHTVKGGAGSQIRWYEIVPLPLNHPTVADSGTVTDGSLWIYDAGISNDRTCTATSCSHGDAMVLGYTTSNATSLPAISMVSKVGTGAQSSPVLVVTSSAPDSDFGCVLLGYCRWGDYGGATPDPAAPTGGATGQVWLTNQTSGPSDGTWNWQATP
jgi:hypothetical protein